MDSLDKLLAPICWSIPHGGVSPFLSPFNPITATLDVIYLFIYLFSKDVRDSYQGWSSVFFLLKRWLTSSHRSISWSAVAADGAADRPLRVFIWPRARTKVNKSQTSTFFKLNTFFFSTSCSCKIILFFLWLCIDYRCAHLCFFQSAEIKVDQMFSRNKKLLFYDIKDIKNNSPY